MKKTATKKVVITNHAETRLNSRRIDDNIVTLALIYGRHFYANGALIYFIGKRDIEKAKKKGVDIRELEGLNLIFNEDNGSMILLTVFKNKSLKRYKY